MLYMYRNIYLQNIHVIHIYIYIYIYSNVFGQQCFYIYISTVILDSRCALMVLAD